MELFREIELGSEAIVYIKNRLACGKTLAEHLLRQDINSGRVITQLPSSVNEGAAKDFESGGKLHSKILDAHKFKLQSVPNTDHLLAVAVFDFLEGSNDRICI